MTDEVAYQNAAQVRQLQAERVNAVLYGQETRIEAIDKQLKAFGMKPEQVKAEPEAEPEPVKAPPQGRATKQERQQKTDKG
jgi:hypothetical protein